MKNAFAKASHTSYEIINEKIKSLDLEKQNTLKTIKNF